MIQEIRTDPDGSRILWLADGKTELAIALDYGIRITHLSCAGMQNLLYRQPRDGSDGQVTAQGWRLYGGHRFWLAPESEASTYPDNQPVQYRLLPNGAEVTQPADPWLQVEKTIRVCFREDGTVEVTHRAKNTAATTLHAALWGVTTLAAGGTAEISYEGADLSDSLVPRRTVSLWGSTNLGDPRVQFTADKIAFRQLPMDDFFKIGVYSKEGFMYTENLGQRLEIRFEPHTIEQLADYGSNAEVYFDRNFMELETLGILQAIAPGESASHTETWRLTTV